MINKPEEAVQELHTGPEGISQLLKDDNRAQGTVSVSILILHRPAGRPLGHVGGSGSCSSCRWDFCDYTDAVKSNQQRHAMNKAYLFIY